ncbi:hypothetical protein [uncultured Corynebacterium sp.]|uniref:hypothetical protein n=1 Tax=uncultured Corynebacterium sp. TaxID=159447 RepID=UPI0025D8F622|nr:hypothetical protein [uncultured Corynebacterium sp.]
MKETSLYRAHIVEEPQFEQYYAFDERDQAERIEWSKPIGWEPSTEYVERFKTNKWIEPDTSKWFKSRSSAVARVKLLQDAGYKAIVQKSAPVEWPNGDEQKVNGSQAGEVLTAIKTLVRHGVIKSADEIL